MVTSHRRALVGWVSGGALAIAATLWSIGSATAADAPAEDDDPEYATVELPQPPPPDGGTITCKAAFVLEGDVVAVSGSRDPDFVDFRVTRAIKGRVPEQVKIINYSGEEHVMEPGDHLLVMAYPVNPAARWAPILQVRGTPLKRDGSVDPPVMSPVKQAAWTETLPDGTTRRQFIPPDRDTVIHSWSPFIIATTDPNPPALRAEMAKDSRNGGLDQETTYHLLSDDPKSLGAPWDELITQLAATAFTAKGCEPAGVYP